jgi:hypothetical protein
LWVDFNLYFAETLNLGPDTNPDPTSHERSHLDHCYGKVIYILGMLIGTVHRKSAEKFFLSQNFIKNYYS